jgi:predicted anti-sigma-YlaC factor YlaD
MLSCDQVKCDLSDALDGALSTARKVQVQLHLTLCPPCRALHDSLDRTVGLLRALAHTPPRCGPAGDEGP